MVVNARMTLVGTPRGYTFAHVNALESQPNPGGRCIRDVVRDVPRDVVRDVPWVCWPDAKHSPLFGVAVRFRRPW